MTHPIRRSRPLPSSLRVAALGAGLATALTPSATLAQQAGGGLPPIAAEPGSGADWRIAIGAAGAVAPDAPGSDELEVLPVPELDIRFRDLLFLSARDGLGANLLRLEGFTAGPVLRYRFQGRDESDNDDFEGLGDVDPTLEAGAFLRYALRPFSASVEVRQGLDGHEGVVVDLEADYGLQVTDRLGVSVGPRASWGDGDFAEAFFGVDAEQSRRSGLDPFDADDAVSVGVGASVRYAITPAVTAIAFGELRQFVGDAADSPIVDERGSATQPFFGLSLSYAFSF